MKYKLVYGYTLYLTEDHPQDEYGIPEEMTFDTEAERDEAVEMLIEDRIKDGFEFMEIPFHGWSVLDSDGTKRGILVTFHKMEEGS